MIPAAACKKFRRENGIVMLLYRFYRGLGRNFRWQLILTRISKFIIGATGNIHPAASPCNRPYRAI